MRSMCSLGDAHIEGCPEILADFQAASNRVQWRRPA